MYVDEKTLRQYFAKYHGDVLGRAYEITAAVILKGFLEVENNCSCVIEIGERHE